MPSTEIIQEAVKKAHQQDGWTITADPYTIEYQEITVCADMAAERLPGAIAFGQVGA